MTTNRTPQVGERWRLRPRPSPEWTCPECGNPIEGRVFGWENAIVKIIGSARPRFSWFVATSCQHPIPMTDGMVLIRHEVEGASVVPYTWLEPLEAEGSPR